MAKGELGLPGLEGQGLISRTSTSSENMRLFGLSKKLSVFAFFRLLIDSGRIGGEGMDAEWLSEAEASSPWPKKTGQTNKCQKSVEC